jgi:predicted porin
MKSFNTLNRAQIFVAMALAGLVSHAAAQSNVTFYGNLDTAVGKTSGTAVTMGPGYFNWLGVAGKEDLGGDLKAVFNLQMRFNPDTGTLSNPGTFWQGESTVGLQSASLGTLRLGRAMSAAWQSLWRLEPWGNGATFATLSGYQTGSYSADGSNDVALNYATFARINNGVFYDSPSWNGASFTVSGEAELAPGARQRNRGAAFNYEAGPVLIVTSYEKNHVADSIAYVGGTYVVDALKLFGSYSHTKVLNLKAENLYLLAATYGLNAHDSLRGGYGGNQGLGSHKVSFGYVHAFSKRTSVYADVWTEHAGNSVNGYAVGVSHSF